MKVSLRYFKPGGKFYTDWEGELPGKHLWEIVHHVEELMEAERLPGLRKGHGLYVVLVEVEGLSGLVYPRAVAKVLKRETEVPRITISGNWEDA